MGATPSTASRSATDLARSCGASIPPSPSRSIPRSAISVCYSSRRVSAAGAKTLVDAGALNRTIVLENEVVFGSVNANRRHYAAAADALVRADRSWLERLVTRRVPLSRWREALESRPGDVKTILDFTLGA